MATPNNDLESKIEKTVSSYAKKLGWLSYKFASPSNRSVPDHLYLRGGMIIFIEFKRAGKLATKHQAHTHKEIEAHGVRVYIIDSIVEGKKLFNLLEV